jgi:fatty-acid peroxygenase
MAGITSTDGPAGWIDRTPAFLARGYDFIAAECDRVGADIAEVRLLGRRTVLLRGRDAARLLYDERLFRRTGALPKRAQRTLTGVGGVQGLDGDAHRHRKLLFVALLDDQSTGIAAAFAEQWQEMLRRRAGRRVSVLDSTSEALCAAISAWCGLPVRGEALHRRTRDLRAMIESGAKLGPAHWRGLAARRRAESALARTVAAVRHDLAACPPSPLRTITLHRDDRGDELPARIAAVELLNLLRPTVAIGRYVAFAAHALGTHADLAARLADDPVLRRSFAHEVRRFYPFFPAVAAIARCDVTFQGRRIRAGRRVLLDLYGTNRHPECPRADEFVTDRHLESPGLFDLVPQGGGDVASGHRCPGEPLTIAVIEAATGVLLDASPVADPRPVDTRPIPTAPADGMLVIPRPQRPFR